MRLTDLLGAELVTEAGERLGHVFDVKVKRDPRSSEDRADQTWKLEALLYGSGGIAERFGLFAARERIARKRHEELPWSNVVAVANGRVTVRESESDDDEADRDGDDRP
jgi:sporulation protein YlmC with PRC-barrel domain